MFPQPNKCKSEQFCIEGTSKEEVEAKIESLKSDFLKTYNDVKVIKNEFIPLNDDDGKIIKYTIKGSFLLKSNIELPGHNYSSKSIRCNPYSNKQGTDYERE